MDRSLQAKLEQAERELVAAEKDFDLLIRDVKMNAGSSADNVAITPNVEAAFERFKAAKARVAELQGRLNASRHE